MVIAASIPMTLSLLLLRNEWPTIHNSDCLDLIMRRSHGGGGEYGRYTQIPFFLDKMDFHELISDT